jgi:hypothetical protein
MVRGFMWTERRLAGLSASLLRLLHEAEDGSSFNPAAMVVVRRLDVAGAATDSVLDANRLSEDADLQGKL